MVVPAADAIAHALDLPEDMADLVPSVPTGLWKQLGLDEKALLDVFENVDTQFEHTRSILKF